MSATRYGLFAVHDSGVPGDSDDYVTLIILHGYAWHAGGFIRLLPLAQSFNARVVLVNRRDYPGSVPYNDEEIRGISSIDATTPAADALSILKSYMQRRAKELYEFLKTFVQKENTPVRGGLVVAGWSFGSVWIEALLANAHDLPRGDAELPSYIRRLILYDPPFHSLGYDPPTDAYSPLDEANSSPEEALNLFQSHVSGYYSHGESASEIEQRKSLSSPSPTFQRMSPKEIESSFDPSPVFPGRSEVLLYENGLRYGLYRVLKEEMLYPREGASSDELVNWDAVKIRYVWCDHSSWQVPWGALEFRAELEDVKASGKKARETEFVRVEGANHFAHWDEPERLLHALLDDDIPEGRIVANTSL